MIARAGSEENGLVPHVIDPGFYDDPDDTIRYLHREMPVYVYDAGPSYPYPLHIVSRWADVRHVESRPQEFVNRFGISLEYAFDGGMNDLDARWRVAMTMPGSTDPPLHTHLRRMASVGFTPKRIRQIEPRVRAIVRKVFDAIPPWTAGDFVDVVARAIPSRVMCDLLGVSYDVGPNLLRWDTIFSAALEPGADGDTAAMVEMLDFLDGEIASRRQQPTEDILSDLMFAERNGDRYSHDEILMWARTILLAGISTTAGLLAGGVKALLDFPDQKALLVQDRRSIRSGIDEMLRWVTPLRYQLRTTTSDCSIGGVAIAEGSKLFLWYLASNRDPDVFTDPFRFDVKRQTRAKHLSFGHGPHFCLGAPLAAMEAAVVVEELLAYFPNIEWGGEYIPDRRTKLNLASEMPVIFGT